jgi:hypothetical protein
VLPLVAGRYLGERTLRRLALARRPHRRRVAGARPVLPWRAKARRHGGWLLAHRLAGRAPPAGAALAL